MNWMKFQSDARLAALVLRAVNHKLRRDIIKLLQKNEPMTVTDIYIQMRMEQSVTSQHLAILRRTGIVNTDRMGKYIYYSVDQEKLESISRIAAELAKNHSLHKKSVTIR